MKTITYGNNLCSPCKLERPEIYLGQPIKFKKAYDPLLRKRVCDQKELGTGKWSVVVESLKIPDKYKQGIIIGIRWAIMTDIVYKNGHYVDDYMGSMSPEYVAGSVTGKQEECYLVSYSLRRKPVLVRKDDVVE